MPSKRAASIIQERNIRYPSEIYVRDIAMSLGALVRERELQGCEARLVRKSDIGIISVNSLILEEGRKRFAIAHEMVISYYIPALSLSCATKMTCIPGKEPRRRR